MKLYVIHWSNIKAFFKHGRFWCRRIHWLSVHWFLSSTVIFTNQIQPSSFFSLFTWIELPFILPPLISFFLLYTLLRYAFESGVTHLWSLLYRLLSPTLYVCYCMCNFLQFSFRPRLCPSARRPLQARWQGGSLPGRSVGVCLWRWLGGRRRCSGLQTAGQGVREHTCTHTHAPQTCTALALSSFLSHTYTDTGASTITICHINSQRKASFRDLTDDNSVMEFWWEC